jgi:MoaA/NifB/PqqE/SkfB family radical SAM enzyme
MKENLGEIPDFLRLAHSCGIKSVRFTSLRPNRRILLGCKVPQRNIRFSYFDQFNSGVRIKFLSELPIYKKLAEELGVTIEAGSMEYDAANVNPFRDVLGRANRKFFGDLLPIPLKRSGGFCVVPWIGQLIVSQDGGVNMCCNTTNHLGNLSDSSLSELWNCDAMRRVRESFKRGEYPRVCGYCRGLGFDEYPKNSRIRGLGLKD